MHRRYVLNYRLAFGSSCLRPFVYTTCPGFFARRPAPRVRDAPIVALNTGDALKRTVVRAFTLIFSRVRGFIMTRALVWTTVKRPKRGRVNRPSRLMCATIAWFRSSAAALAVVILTSQEVRKTSTIRGRLREGRNPTLSGWRLEFAEA